ncbi:hypothetical protein D3C87_1087160 [compost metagenome]
MNTSHAQFQAAFADALFAPRERVDPRSQHLVEQPAFAVYRNTVMKGCIDALEANFPAVVRLVGRDWFRAAAAVHVAVEAPRDGRMLTYGERFADFLRDFKPAAELPYLPGVAQLDALWRESHAAQDAPVLDATGLSLVDPEAIARLKVPPHPSARWGWFDAQPVFTIWSRNRQGANHSFDADATESSELLWQGEGALLTRPADTVFWRAIPKAGCVFLDACTSGLPLADAAERAQAVEPDVDLAALFGTLLRAGAFASNTHALAPAGGTS